VADKKLMVRLGLDNRKYKNALTQSKAYSHRFASSVQKRLNAINMKRAIMGVTAFAAAVTAATTYVVKAAAEQESIFRALQTQVELSGNAWTESKIRIDAFAKTLQETTKYGDTDTAKVLQKIMIYTQDLGEAMMGTKLAMDMAASKMFDIGTAARYVGMAMGGNVEILGRYILELKASENAMLKNMTATEKAAYAMDILKRKFGGAAEEELKTFTGRMDQTKNYIVDLAEAIGDSLLPYMTKIAIKTREVTEKAIEWVSANQNWINAKVHLYVMEMYNALKKLYEQRETIVKVLKTTVLTIAALKLISIAASMASLAKSLILISMTPLGAWGGIIAGAAAATAWGGMAVKEVTKKSDKPIIERFFERGKKKEAFSFGGGGLSRGRGVGGSLAGDLKMRIPEGGDIPLRPILPAMTPGKIGRATFYDLMAPKGVDVKKPQLGMFPGESLNKGYKKLLDFNSGLTKTKEITKELSTGWVMLGNQISWTLGNALTQSGNTFANIARSFRQMLTQMVADLAARAAVFAVLNAITGGGFSGLTGGMKGFLGFRASGGSVSADKPYVVGEQGPELFVPKSHGKIIPNQDINNSSDNRQYIFQINAGDKNKYELAETINELITGGYIPALVTA